MATLFLATNNEGKLKEIKDTVCSFFDKIMVPSDIDSFEPEENGATYLENALIKARYWHKKTGYPTLSDDSGLNIIALNNWPGVQTAPFSKNFKSYFEAQSHIAEKLTPFCDKSVFFQCTLAYIDESGTEHIFDGVLNGTYCFPPKAGAGFAYDNVFIPDGYTKTVAELGSFWKSKHSHRAKALNLFMRHLKSSRRT